MGEGVAWKDRLYPRSFVRSDSLPVSIREGGRVKEERERGRVREKAK